MLHHVRGVFTACRDHNCPHCLCRQRAAEEGNCPINLVDMCVTSMLTMVALFDVDTQFLTQCGCVTSPGRASVWLCDVTGPSQGVVV